jgi:rod shape-determining protein MreD
MRRLIALPVVVLAAATAAVTLTSVEPRLGGRVDFFLIVVVYAAITRSRPAAIVTGAAAGLVQDVLTSQVLGFHTFVKTFVAWLVGGMGGRLMLNHPVPQVLALLLATLLDAAVAALLALASGLPPPLDVGALAWQAALNSLVGLAAFRLLHRAWPESGPAGAVERGI